MLRYARMQCCKISAADHLECIAARHRCRCNGAAFNESIMALHSSAAPSARNRYRIFPLSLVLQRALTGQRHMRPWPNPFTGMTGQDVYNAFEICFREEY